MTPHERVLRQICTPNKNKSLPLSSQVVRDLALEGTDRSMVQWKDKKKKKKLYYQSILVPSSNKHSEICENKMH